MDPRIARRVALAGLACGVAADILLDGVDPGLNVLVAVVAMFAVVTRFRPSGSRIDRFDLWLPPVGLLAATAVALRSDPVVIWLDVTLAACALGAWAVAVTGRPVTRSSASAVTALGASVLASAGVGAMPVIPSAMSGAAAAEARDRLGRSAPVLRGLALAVPAVLVFGVLLVSADPVFRHYVDVVLNLPIDLSDVSRRAGFVFVVGWLVAGLLAVAAARSPLIPPVAPTAVGTFEPVVPSDRPRRGATEATVVLFAVELLFAMFVSLQFAYLFGGLDTLEAAGLTYSDYARQGYFQLVAVVLLAGVLLAVVERRVGRGGRFVGAALGFVGLTVAILASAVLRLSLYLQAYGWTELRFYVAASIVWLAFGAGLVIVLLLRDRMRWLVHGVALSAIAITLGLSALGPQAFIADRNLERVLDPRLIPPDGESGFDAAYLAAFSDDAVPLLVAALERLEPVDRAVLLDALAARRTALESDPASRHWAAWNLSRERARMALASLPAR